jgi:mono/diheme cytochrome c family protein
MTPTVIITGILTLLAAITLIVVYWPYATHDMTPSDIFRTRTQIENEGRKIYLENGCVYCHSQSIRSIDWGHGAQRIAQTGDYVADEPVALGSQRTGVDLSQEGGEHPDDWHIAHFIKERIDKLTQYMQSLGFKDADRRMQRQRYWKAVSVRAYEAGPDENARWLAEIVPEGWRNIPNPYPTTTASLQRGQKIYQNFCISCHGPIGDGMGPGQPWMYPPPLNFTILKGREISGGIIYYQYYQIMNGITGTAMPYFKRDLESQKIWEVGDYVAVYFINQSDANAEPRGIDSSWEP